jgi:hypothetical protein
MMGPRLRTFALTAHVTSSVGWFGAVAGFLALAVAGLRSDDPQMVRAAYLAMDVTGWFVIVPFSLASLLTGLVQSLGTPWGLFRHYWILIKLLITIVATMLLLLHMQPTAVLADAAAQNALSSTDLRGLRIQLVADAGAALIVLLVATALAVYKPRGLTPYGRRRQREELSPRSGSTDQTRVESARGLATTTPLWVRVFGLMIVVLILLVVVLHLTGRGLGGH